jgi:predicted RNA-binding Zn ribbon-like protein
VVTTPIDFRASDEDLLLAVANTGHGAVDELGGLAEARAWWQELTGAPAPRAVGDEADLELLRRARGAIRALALRNNGVDVEVDGAQLGSLPLRFVLADEPSLVAGGESSLLRELTARTVSALLRASGGAGWRRVKACPGPGCAWVFHDRSRNGSRRWCDMAECGNRSKGAAFRARHRVAS